MKTTKEKRNLIPYILGIGVIMTAGLILIILPKKKESQGLQSHSPLHRDWDAVDEASWESFPASDPPAH